MKRYFNSFIALIKSLSKTPRGKGILFFGFYFVFFIVIAIAARIGGNSNFKDVNNRNTSDFTVSGYNGDNYAFKYTIYLDDNTYEVKGSKIGLQSKFTIDDKEYYKNGLNYYVNNNSEWKYLENINNYLTIIDNIDDIISNASYLAKTEYQSGQEVYIYQIDSNSISNIINNTNYNAEEDSNEITITINDDRINSVLLDLNSYCTTTNSCDDNMKIVLEYSGFELQEEIINPLN